MRATRSSHSARSVAIDEERNVAMAAAARSATATSRASSSASMPCSPTQAKVSTPTPASTLPLPATTSGRSALVIRVPSTASPIRPSDPVRSSAAWWTGCSGLVTTSASKARTASSAMPSVRSSSRALRSGSWAKTAAIAAPVAVAPASTITASAVSRSCARASGGRAGREHAERAAR